MKTATDPAGLQSIPPASSAAPALPPSSDGEPEMAGRNARRWSVKAHIDDNVCEPCRDNDGKVYRNRQAAYRDYPNGRGYKKCVGAQYGNTCRCKVIKRGKGEENSMGLAEIVARAQAYADKVPAKALIIEKPDATFNPAPFRAQAGQGGKHNALYVYDMIGGWDGTKALDVALALRDMDGPVDVHLNSPGGVIFEGAAIYNALRAYSGGPITSYVDGYAASAASFVMLAASPYDENADTGGVRFAKNATAMVHDGSGFAMGTADDMRDVADLLDMLSDTIAEIYAEHCGGTADEWRETMRDGDTWYTAEQAKAAGLATHIVGEIIPAEPEPANRLDISLFSPRGEMQATGTPPLAVTSLDIEGLRSALKGAFQ